MPTLGIDLRALPSDGSPGAGIAHASRALAHALYASIPEGWNLHAFIYGNPDFDLQIPHTALSTPKSHALKKAVQRSGVDALFCPTGSVPLNLSVPAFPWIHDLDILDHPEWFPQSALRRWYTTSVVKRGIKKAPGVFVVSEYTKKQIAKWVRIDEKKMIVTKESGDLSWENIPEEELLRMRAEIAHALRVKEIGGPFILMLGTVEPRKNYDFILKIWQQVIKRNPHIHLIIAGKTGWKTDAFDEQFVKTQKMIHEQKSGGSVIRLDDVDDELRKTLLLSAEVVLVPSKSEGFGLVALEAAQVRTPVLTSDRGALPEVLGSGIWTLPLEEKEWRDSILHILDQRNEREVMADMQYRVAKNLTWQSVADKVWRGVEQGIL